MLAASLGYTVLILGFTWPACLQMSERLLGSPHTDVCVGVWGLWWYHRALSTGVSPFRGNALGFPDGGAFFVADPLNALLSVPFQYLLDLTSTYNLVIMGNLLLACLATFALLRYLRVPPPAAFVGGVAYGLNVYVASYIQNGVSQEVAIGWLPLFVLRFLVLLRNGRQSNVVWASLSLAITSMSSWYHAACAFLLVPLIAWPFRSRAQTMRKAVWTVVGALALLTPFLLLQLHVLSDPRTLEVRQALPLEASFDSQDGSDIVRFFSHAADPEWIRRGYLHAPCLGWVVLDLATWGALFARRKSLARPWIAPALVFLVLGLGFVLEVNGWFVTVWGRLVPLPFLFLYRFMPGFSWLGFPHRFIVPALLALACLAAHGAADLMRPLGASGRALLAIALSLGVFLEIALLSPLTWPIASTSSVGGLFYAQAGASAERFGILDLPTTSAAGPISKRYFYFQTVHGKGIPYGIDATVGRRFPGAFARNPLLRQLAMFDLLPGFVRRRLDAHTLIAGLRALGYRYIVLHTSAMTDIHLADLRLFLEPVLSAPDREGDRVIYTLP